MYEDLLEKFEMFREKHYEFTGLIICSNQGDILFTTQSLELSSSDCQQIINSWLHSAEQLNLHEIRYTILKTDIYQFAALNPHLKKGIVGSMDREYNYAIGFVDTETNPENSLLLSSIELNKLVWNMN
ncbi:MAG: hypothetical protein JW776_01900 [Candidatus Lokiarchaeota archaeon]|nr:hypothetical protein [Candidatus Lokiarchaeota archaeon]